MLVLVDTGRGNLRSVEKALAAAGGQSVRTADPDLIRRADRVVVPGQGAFADAMVSLNKGGAAEAVLEFIGTGKPYLGICLGLQLLFDESEEHGPVAGLGVLPGTVRRLPGSNEFKVPHMGWNDVHQAGNTNPVLAPTDGSAEGSHFYFVHSYAAKPDREHDLALVAEHGGSLCAAVARENIVATQFHPEKSQDAGIALLQRFLAWTPGEA